ncbi:hypothetical protein C6P44_000032 [Monosporozyma unispora]|nr:hypothetical protein C6P44_000032 [Kazachstania unispora]
MKEEDLKITTELTTRLETQWLKQEPIKISEFSKYYFENIPPIFNHITSNLTYNEIKTLFYLLKKIFHDSNFTTYEKFLIIMPSFSQKVRNKFFYIVQKYHGIILKNNLNQFLDILACICSQEIYVFSGFKIIFKRTSFNRDDFYIIDSVLRGLTIALDDHELALDFMKRTKDWVKEHPKQVQIPIQANILRDKVNKAINHFHQVNRQKANSLEPNQHTMTRTPPRGGNGPGNTKKVKKRRRGGEDNERPIPSPKKFETAG